VGAALCYPLVIVDGVIVLPAAKISELVAWIATLVALVVDALIIWQVWKAASRPADETQPV